MLALVMVFWFKIALMCFLCFLLLLMYLGKWSWLMFPRCVKQFDFYLAGGMRGYKNKNKAMFLKVATLMRDRGFSVFNPAEVNDEELTFAECMTVDLDAVINKCKGIAFLPGWRNSLGANAEAMAASVCGKPGYQTRLVKKETEVRLKKISLKNYCLPYKVKRKK